MWFGKNELKLLKRSKDFFDWEALSRSPLNTPTALSRHKLDPIKLTYNLSRPDGRLELAVSAFNRLQLVSQQSWLQGPLLRRTHRFFRKGGQINQRRYS